MTKELKIVEQYCKGCEICVAFCPKKVLGLSDRNKVKLLDKESCTGCGLCEMRCPDFAIYLEEVQPA